MARKNAYRRKMLRMLDAREKVLLRKRKELYEKRQRIWVRFDAVNTKLREIDNELERTLDAYLRWSKGH